MRYIKSLSTAAGAACLAAALVGTPATPALADYGTGAQYQIEISANNAGGMPGDGVWLWIELNGNGSGDYTGSDCIHTGSAGLNGAGNERGDVTWTDSGGKLTIQAAGAGNFPAEHRSCLLPGAPRLALAQRHQATPPAQAAGCRPDPNRRRNPASASAVLPAPGGP
jgi:hypothetical protein